MNCHYSKHSDVSNKSTNTMQEECTTALGASGFTVGALLVVVWQVMQIMIGGVAPETC
jgi:hypothetical protein